MSFSPSPPLPLVQRHWFLIRALLFGFALLFALVIASVPPLPMVAVMVGAVVVVAVLRYPVTALYLLAFAIPWGSALSPGGSAATLTPVEPLIALVAGVWLASAAYQRKAPIPATPWTPYILLFIGAIALSATQASNPASSAKEVLKWIELAIVYFAGSQLLDSRSSIRRLAAVLTVAGVSQAVLGFFQAAYSLGPAAFAANRLLFRSYGTFDQPNPYAGYLNMILPLALAMAVRAPVRLERRLYALAAALIFAAELASQSRGALLAGVLASVVVAVCLYPRLVPLAWSGPARCWVWHWLPRLISCLVPSQTSF